MNILIADDEPLVRFSVRDILSELPIKLNISEAESGTEMIESIRSSHPDIALVDICMPGINGLNAIETLNSIAKETKWIILSGHSEFEYSRQALRLGVVDYLLKPVDPDELCRTIGRTMNIIAAETRGEIPDIDLDNDNGQPKDMTELLVRHAQITAARRFRDAIGVAQIAEELNVTPNYLSTVFKRYTGQALTTYLTNLRLEESRRLLKEPGINVKEASTRLGYSSSRHFAHLFREKYGLSPSEYQMS